jgi:molybdopterin-containing oxidoreductase family iron-sulfur binding subunit
MKTELTQIGRAKIDLAALRERLDKAKGPAYWKSLEELAETEEFKSFIDDEFPTRSPEWLKAPDRRTVMKLMGASFALAGLSACTKQPKELIVPYVHEPEEFVPGKPLFFATAFPMGGVGTGVLVESHLGRPTKVEGNPDHPGSLGSTNIFAQASVLELWDPDRAQSVTHYGELSTWPAALSALITAGAGAVTKNGAGLYILTQRVASPTLEDRMKALLGKLPGAKWHQYEPASSSNAQGGARLAFGRPVNPVYHFENADVVVSLDADFLRWGTASVRYARDFASRRRILIDAQKLEQPKENQQEGYQPGPDAPFRNQASTHTLLDHSPEQYPPQVRATGIPPDQATQPRLYVVEPAPSLAGSMADHRFILRASEVEGFARDLAAAVETSGATEGSNPHKAIAAIAKDLQGHRGRCLIVPGEFQTPAVHALAHAMNEALGNVGTTVVYTDPLEANPVNDVESLRQLTADMNAGKVETLVILGGNPIYDAPVDVDFAGAMNKVALRFHVGLYSNETSMLCHWQIPEAHYLESWGDIRGYDGTVTIMQPLIEPLYGGKAAVEILSALTEPSGKTAHTLVKDHWRAQSGVANFEPWWETCLHNGTVPNTAHPPISVTAKAPPPAAAAQSGQGIEIIFRPDATVYDGRYANLGWLQELPKPTTRMTWDNPVLVSPRMAQRYGLSNEDVVEFKYRGRSVKAPVMVQPGHADDAVTVSLGYGRTVAGRVANEVGVDFYKLRTADALWHDSGLAIQKTSDTYSLAVAQRQATMDERTPVRVATIEEFKKDPRFADEGDTEAIPDYLTLYPKYMYQGYKWGMSIDLNTCMGCGTCTIACQAENNIAVVGKEETGKGRWMHWIRVDRYFHGHTMDDPEIFFQPVPCMQCENAPCEQVCPVGATVHSGDGLNQMIYNRCVGTRYCSNNCPYKVRRFNFLLYSDWYTQSMYGLRNPDVTVRSRGVMEKCTYCIQRINAAKILAEREDRRVREGEIIPACVQACPTQAIVFGDINDPNSQVAKLKAQARDYSLLEDLNTRPRTTYLARLKNPNPEIEQA